MSKVILFDLGGVVTETKFNRVLDKYAKKYDWDIEKMKQNIFGEEYMQLLAGKVNLAQFTNWLTNQITSLSIAELQEFVREYYFSEETKDEVIKLLAKIPNRYKLGLVTNDIGRLDDKLSYLNLVGIFDRIINSFQVGYCKPQVEIYQAALDRFNVSAQEVIYIDNDPVCLDNASTLGVETIRFFNYQQLENEFIRLKVLNQAKDSKVMT